MNGPGPANNHSFRPANPGHSNGQCQLGQHLGGNRSTILIDQEDDSAGSAGIQITQVHSNTNYFFNKPGEYNINWNNDTTSGNSQARLGPFSRNVPANSVVILPASSGSFGLFGGGTKATTTQNQVGSTSANGNGNGSNVPISTSSTERPAFTRVRMPGTPTPNGPRAD